MREARSWKLADRDGKVECDDRGGAGRSSACTCKHALAKQGNALDPKQCSRVHWVRGLVWSFAIEIVHHYYIIPVIIDLKAWEATQNRRLFGSGPIFADLRISGQCLSPAGAQSKMLLRCSLRCWLLAAAVSRGRHGHQATSGSCKD